MRTVQVITPPRHFKALQRHSPPSSSTYTQSLLKRKQAAQQTAKFIPFDRSLNMLDSVTDDKGHQKFQSLGHSAQIESNNSRAASAIPNKDT